MPTQSQSSRIVRYERIPGTPLTADQREELERLKNLPDDQIDLSDIPEWTDEMFDRAIKNRELNRARFFRPVKQPVTVRIDADIVHWLKSQGKGYQTRLNSHLRQWMRKELLAETKKAAQVAAAAKPARKAAKAR